jgi:hypothetical protein
LVFKNSEILIHVTTLSNLEDFVLTEINQTPKGKYFIILLLDSAWNSQINRNRKSWLPGPRRRSEWGSDYLMDTEFQFEKMKIWGVDGSDGYTT